MAIKQTKDVLDQVVRFHKKVAWFLDWLGNGSHGERTKLLLDHISRHEKHMQKVLQDYEENVRESVLQTWFQETPDLDFFQCIENIELNQEQSVDDLIEFACKLDDCVIAHYQRVAECAGSPKIQEVFNKLLELENREKIKMVKQAIRLNDL